VAIENEWAILVFANEIGTIGLSGDPEEMTLAEFSLAAAAISDAVSARPASTRSRRPFAWHPPHCRRRPHAPFDLLPRALQPRRDRLRVRALRERDLRPAVRARREGAATRRHLLLAGCARAQAQREFRRRRASAGQG
jgi:hypothetical protein